MAGDDAHGVVRTESIAASYELRDAREEGCVADLAVLEGVVFVELEEMEAG